MQPCLAPVQPVSLDARQEVAARRQLLSLDHARRAAALAQAVGAAGTTGSSSSAASGSGEAQLWGEDMPQGGGEGGAGCALVPIVGGAVQLPPHIAQQLAPVPGRDRERERETRGARGAAARAAGSTAGSTVGSAQPTGGSSRESSLQPPGVPVTAPASASGPLAAAAPSVVATAAVAPVPPAPAAAPPAPVANGGGSRGGLPSPREGAAGPTASCGMDVVLRVNGHVLPFLCAATLQSSPCTAPAATTVLNTQPDAAAAAASGGEDGAAAVTAPPAPAPAPSHTFRLVGLHNVLLQLAPPALPGQAAGGREGGCAREPVRVDGWRVLCAKRRLLLMSVVAPGAVAGAKPVGAPVHSISAVILGSYLGGGLDVCSGSSPEGREKEGKEEKEGQEGREDRQQEGPKEAAPKQPRKRSSAGSRRAQGALGTAQRPVGAAAGLVQRLSPDAPTPPVVLGPINPGIPPNAVFPPPVRGSAATGVGRSGSGGGAGAGLKRVSLNAGDTPVLPHRLSAGGVAQPAATKQQQQPNPAAQLQALLPELSKRPRPAWSSRVTPYDPSDPFSHPLYPGGYTAASMPPPPRPSSTGTEQRPTPTTSPQPVAAGATTTSPAVGSAAVSVVATTTTGVATTTDTAGAAGKGGDKQQAQQEQPLASAAGQAQDAGKDAAPTDTQPSAAHGQDAEKANGSTAGGENGKANGHEIGNGNGVVSINGKRGALIVELVVSRKMARMAGCPDVAGAKPAAAPAANGSNGGIASQRRASRWYGGGAGSFSASGLLASALQQQQQQNGAVVSGTAAGGEGDGAASAGLHGHRHHSHSHHQSGSDAGGTPSQPVCEVQGALPPLVIDREMEDAIMAHFGVLVPPLPAAPATHETPLPPPPAIPVPPPLQPQPQPSNAAQQPPQSAEAQLPNGVRHTPPASRDVEGAEVWARLRAAGEELGRAVAAASGTGPAAAEDLSAGRAEVLSAFCSTVRPLRSYVIPLPLLSLSMPIGLNRSLA